MRLKVERALGPLADSLERELEKVDGELYTQSIRSEHHWETARQKLIRENRRGRRNAMRALQRELGASEGREASADGRRTLELLRRAAAEHTEAAQRRREERQAARDERLVDRVSSILRKERGEAEPSEA